MREVEGMSYEEMAVAMNVSKGTIMSRLFHARQKLQRALGDYYRSEGGGQSACLEEGRAAGAMSTRDAPSGTVPGGRTPTGAPPTDLELMLWVDGELDADRAGEVADYIRADARAARIVSALRQGSQTIAEDALRHAELSDADNIADNVMEAIDAAASRHLIAPVRRAPAWRAPAVAALGIALAAAAAWTLIFPSELVPVSKRAPAPASVSSGATVAAVEEEAKEGVWIDVVDFGTRPGTIFYVPSEDESILPVVWLTEDDTPSSGDMP